MGWKRVAKRLPKVGGGVDTRISGAVRKVPVVGQGWAALGKGISAIAHGEADRHDWSRVGTAYALPILSWAGGVDLFPDRDKSRHSATAPGTPGSNAGDFNSAYTDTLDAQQAHEAEVAAWEQSRIPYYDQIRDTQYQQSLGVINDQQRDATQANAFQQARSGTRGGSADLGAQAQLQQAGLTAQGQAFMQADAAALRQQQIDADHAAWMRAQGYNYYDPVAKLGSFQAQNLERSSSQLYDWNKQSYENRTGMSQATQGIGGAFTGGVMNAGMTQAGGVMGDYFGSAAAKPEAPKSPGASQTTSSMFNNGNPNAYTGGL